MPQYLTIDGCEAAARIAYLTSEVVAIYPITPSSTMGELADAWAAQGKPNLWGAVPTVRQMQSEGGAAGAVHGALQAGAVTTTFTASQGLLLMIPNMYKIAGELTCAVFHVTARSIATHALSIFGDHSDVMATRATGWAMLFGANVQEAHDFALITQMATLDARVPFLNVFDGFRTSHEVQKIVVLEEHHVRSLIDEEHVQAHRNRRLNPDDPVMRGTAQNPDVFFQAREAANPTYRAVEDKVRGAMRRFAEVVGRTYDAVEYHGHPEAERVVVLMGSALETACEVADHLIAKGERVGVLKIRLFRPFPAGLVADLIPSTAKRLAVLDRTKEPGAAGEPLYQDVITALFEAGRAPLVIGGRYGLSSKEFTPAMAKAVFDELSKPEPKNHFTVGILDDVSHTSLAYDPDFVLRAEGLTQAVFWGLGADGTVGANKNSIKIIGEGTDLFAQGYFVYDSKKSGSMTVSHLRFGPNPIRAPYLIDRADFVAVHQFGFLDRFPVLDCAAEGATVLIDTPFPAEELWEALPRPAQEAILRKGLRVFAIDAASVAKECGLGRRINTIMQTAFFALSGVLPRVEAIERIRDTIKKTYGRRGEAVVRQNFEAVDKALEGLREVEHTGRITNDRALRAAVAGELPDFVAATTAPIVAGLGDELPVSKLPIDGTFPTATAQYEKRAISTEAPVWDPDLCIQCGKCVLVCPHAVIRAKVLDSDALAAAPGGFLTRPANWRGLQDRHYTIQVSADDCTGCGICVEVCPARDKRNTSKKALDMAQIAEDREPDRARWRYFESLPEGNPSPEIKFNNIKNVQLLRPLFEFSGACSGCGETPYLKLLSQLFGDRALIANATGCSSIYGGNLPTTPWAKNAEGRGPAWSNSLFEDNAEFGMGMRLALDARQARALELLPHVAPEIAAPLREALAQRDTERQRELVSELMVALGVHQGESAAELGRLADALVEKSVWIVGGDGWAYDIGFGGLDHVLASGENVNVLVLDTEVYSNTGGQASKSTSRAAVAKFAAGGKAKPKKDLAKIAMSYGDVYVAQIAMGSSDAQTLKAFLEAESYPGPSLIVAYSHCIAHGIDMRQGMSHQKMATESGHWPLFRFDPRRTQQGENPMQIDSKEPSLDLAEYLYSEVRYRMLQQTDPDAARELLAAAKADVRRRWQDLTAIANREVNP